MFAETLKKIRKINKMTQDDLANRLNISRSTIAGYETEGKEPSFEVLRNMARILNVSTDVLLELSPVESINSNVTYFTNEHLREDEKLMLSSFNKCDDDCKEYLISKAKVLSIEGLVNVQINDNDICVTKKLISFEWYRRKRQFNN